MTTCSRAGGHAWFNYTFLTSKERDIETGLDYFLARYFSSLQGRFTSADPLLASGKSAIPQSWNRYTYCINNPLILVDPTGMIWGYQDFEENGKKLRRYVWFEGKKVGKGFTAFTPDRDGSIIALKDGNYARLYRQGTYTLIAGAPKITVSGQERLNAAAGMFDGAIPFGKQIREAALGGPGAVYTDSPEYNNASTISEGVLAGALLLTGVGPAKLSDEAIGLTKQLASEGQVAEILGGTFDVIAGPGSKRILRDAPRLAAQHGGSIGEWQKISSSYFKAADGSNIAVHAYRNVSTGKIVEMKSVF